MNEVEKYGLFAVVLVGGLITLIAVSGGDDEDPATALNGPPVATASRGAPTVIPFEALPDNPPPAPRKNRRNPNTAQNNPRPAAGQAQAADGRHSPSRAPATRPNPNGPLVKAVKPLLPEHKPFSWDEDPVPYQGPRAERPQPPTTRATPTAGQPAGSSATPSTYTVKSGDTLSGIASATLGSSTRWKELVALNPGLDPMTLQVGQVIQVRAGAATSPATVPASAAAAEPPPKDTGPSTYTVKPGDTLSQIASATLGTTRRTDELFAANREKLDSPDDLKVGQVLIIP